MLRIGDRNDLILQVERTPHLLCHLGVKLAYGVGFFGMPESSYRIIKVFSLKFLLQFWSRQGTAEEAALVQMIPVSNDVPACFGGMGSEYHLL